MSGLTLASVSKSFGAVHAVQNASLDVKRGEFIVFVGPSGCGKSILLRMIAGLEYITSGTLSVGGKMMNDVSLSERGVGAGQSFSKWKMRAACRPVVTIPRVLIRQSVAIQRNGRMHCLSGPGIHWHNNQVRSFLQQRVSRRMAGRLNFVCGRNYQ